MQLAQDISSRMYVKKRRRSGLRRGFLACIIGEIDKSRCVNYFSTVPYLIVKSHASPVSLYGHILPVLSVRL